MTWPASPVATSQPWDEGQQRKRREVQHIHACAMLVLDCTEAEAQSIIMDYIIAHEKEVPLFMLNEVPWYVKGYRAAQENND